MRKNPKNTLINARSIKQIKENNKQGTEIMISDDPVLVEFKVGLLILYLQNAKLRFLILQAVDSKLRFFDLVPFD